MSLPSKWADSPSDTATPTKPVSKPVSKPPNNTSKKDEPLSSKWAEPVTSKRGAPLASKWAIASDGDGQKKPVQREGGRRESSSNEKKQQGNQRNNRHHEPQVDGHGKKTESKGNHGQVKAKKDGHIPPSSGANDLASRLGTLTLDPQQPNKSQKRNNNQTKSHPRKPKQGTNEAFDGTSANRDHGNTDGKAKPSPAAKDFASRLGISLANEKLPHRPTKPRSSLRDQPRQEKVKHARDSNTNRQRAGHKEKPGRPVYEPEPEIELTEEEQKRVDATDRLIDQINSGAKINWADLDDDDDF